MKIRLLSSVFILALILTFSSCGEKKAEYRVTAFSAQVTAVCEGEAYEGSLIFFDVGDIAFEVTLPEQSQGLTFCLEGGKKLLRQGNVSVSAEGFGGIFALLEALSAFSRDSYTLSAEGQHKIKISSGREDFTVVFSADEGRITEIASSCYTMNFAYDL